MKKFISYLLLATLISIVVFPSFAQQNQNTPITGTDVEALQKRVSDLESKLQTVENVEKMELAAKLADAQAKLLNIEIEKYKRGLKDENDDWLRTWSIWFVSIIGFLVLILGGGFWYWLRSKADQLIANEVEKRINRFQEAFDQVTRVNEELRILEKEHAVTVLDNFNPGYPVELEWHTESIKALSEEMLLSIFNDTTRELEIRWAAADVLVIRKSERLFTPMLTFLNSIVFSKIDPDIYHARFCDPHPYWDWLTGFYNEETYQGLKEFIKHLIEEDSENKVIFINWTLFLLAQISLKLDLGDSVDLLKKGIPDLQEFEIASIELTTLAKYFNRFKEPEGIKDILRNGLTDKLSDAEQECLELLQDHDPDFVKEWKAQKEAANTENEESS